MLVDTKWAPVSYFYEKEEIQELCEIHKHSWNSRKGTNLLSYHFFLFLVFYTLMVKNISTLIGDILTQALQVMESGNL